MTLYHYYEKEAGPFRSVSRLGEKNAAALFEDIRQKRPQSMCAKRDDDYMQKRFMYKSIMREAFRKKGGIIAAQFPYYMVVGECKWLESWYSDPAKIVIDISDLDTSVLSFTYGDSHPTFSPLVNDGRPYRKQLYTYSEILEVIKEYGYPQDWNSDGSKGPERYIEVQIWSDDAVSKYLRV